MHRISSIVSHLLPPPSSTSLAPIPVARDDKHFETFQRVHKSTLTSSTPSTSQLGVPLQSAGLEILRSLRPHRTLSGSTIFITGASRGIGLAIALRAARDGANIVIAAKTTDPHPQLEGTIFTAAKAVEEAGGHALPVKCDIRDERSVCAAVEAAAKRFGGIDILINNASAISLTPIEETSTKKFDLMHDIETRGTFIVTRECIKYLKKSPRNPHILSLSPPLENLSASWLAPHTPYTMAKFNMSIIALGVAEELRPSGVASNCLWPRTVIATAAVSNLLGGQDMIDKSRKPDIMADAAYEILTTDSTKLTGFGFVDTDVLKARGVKSFTKYAVKEGTRDEEMARDFFV